MTANRDALRMTVVAASVERLAGDMLAESKRLLAEAERIRAHAAAIVESGASAPTEAGLTVGVSSHSAGAASGAPVLSEDAA